MHFISLTLLFAAQMHCEWVEISQQHYKKPIKLTHNYPFLTTTARIIETERTTNRNRVYINNSLPEYNWKTGFVNKFSEGDEIKTVINVSKFKDPDRTPVHSGKNNGEVAIIRRPKPESTSNQGQFDESKKRPPTRPVNQGFRNPVDLEAYEIFNLSDLSDDEDRAPTETPGKKYVNRPTGSPDTAAHEKMQTSKIKRVNKTRSSTTQTPTKQFQEKQDYRAKEPGNSKPSEILNKREKPRPRPPTTPYKFPNIGIVKRVNKTGAGRPTPASTLGTSTTSRDEETFIKRTTNHFNSIRRIDEPQIENTGKGTRTTPVNIQKTQDESTEKYKLLSPDDIMIEEIIKEDPGKIAIHNAAGTVRRVKNPKEAEPIRRTDNLSHKASVQPTTHQFEKDVGNDPVKDNSYKKLHNVGDFLTSTEQYSKSTTIEFKSIHKITTKRPDHMTQIESYQPNPYRPLRPSQEPPPEFVTKEQHFSEDEHLKNQSEGTSDKTEPTHGTVNENVTVKDETRDDTNQEPTSERKPNAIENLVKILKTVTDIISKNSRRGVLGKLRYLEDLRDTILANIEERLEAAFPDEGPRPVRRARSAPEAQARGHVEFPSSESALMTISFLTFAVFLIKLVLQVIHAYKNKTMMVMPTVISAVSRALNERHTAN